jgi:hypothetical protein
MPILQVYMAETRIIRPRQQSLALSYIVSLGNCPIVWKSHLQTEITLSTLEAEYSALSSSLRIVLPLRDLLLEIIAGIKLPQGVSTTLKCRVFEDNNGALLLATQQKITKSHEVLSRQVASFLGTSPRRNAQRPKDRNA